MEQPIKIAITGGESTGKTTLANQLAKHFGGLAVREMAREYLQNKHSYDVTDVLQIASMQKKEEESVTANASKGQFVFCDTEWINIRIWLEDKNWDIPSYIEQGIEDANYNLYLLLKPDLPWEWDPLRENEHRAMYFYTKFLNELKKRNKNFEIIEGVNNQRQENAIRLLNKLYF